MASEPRSNDPTWELADQIAAPILARFDRILAEHEALRSTNRELHAKNQELTRDLATLRRRYTKEIGRRRGDIESASSRRNPPKRRA